ncbi:GTPase RsgA [Streptomyces sp. NPDC052051]|uniref:GTPase RsgA n=1 Tax=Streptomyces sp. NPDC052051 TaxID=3154649 RepID=UPI003411FF07
MPHAVLERRTTLVRSTASRTSRGQVLAADVDTVAVTVSLGAVLEQGRAERVLALAWECGARSVVVFTGADRCAAVQLAAAGLSEVTAGTDVLVTSAVAGLGLDTLTAVLNGAIVLLGPSGAGMSTPGNQLLGEDRPATAVVRDVDGKGRHTTAWRELTSLPGGGVPLSLWSRETGVRWVGEPGSMAGWLICCGMT